MHHYDHYYQCPLFNPRGSTLAKDNGDVPAIGNISDPALKGNIGKRYTRRGIKFNKMANAIVFLVVS